MAQEREKPSNFRLKPTASAVELAALEDALAELEQREKEFLNIYEPLPFQEAFHRATAKEVILAKGVRVGGTLCFMVEVARAVLGLDPYNKYPANGTCILLGYGERHVGNVFYRYLFKEGGSRIRILRDQKTGKWRAYRPWSKAKGGDEGDEHLCEDAPALIPRKYVEEFVWEKRGANIFSMAKIRTPRGAWDILTANSNGDPNQLVGIDCDLYGIDEDLATSGWHEEAVSRTLLVDGKIRWNAVPAEKTDDMVNMIDRANRMSGTENPSTVKIEATIFDNIYMSETARKESMAIWRDAGEDVVQRRAYGKLSTDSVRVYPGFNERIHNAIVTADDPMATEVQKIVSRCGGDPPASWCRYLAIDPGHQVLAVLFAAVPPPSVGDQVVIYDELYITQADAVQLGDKIAARVIHEDFEAFIIDAHGGRLSSISTGLSPIEVYQKEFLNRGIKSRSTANGFVYGSDDVKGREEILRTWLRIREDGSPKLLVCCEKCPNFVREMKGFKKKRIKTAAGLYTTDEGDRRFNTHAVESVEYLVAHGLPYVAPPSAQEPTSWLERVRLMNRPRRRLPEWMGGRTISLGPGG